MKTRNFPLNTLAYFCEPHHSSQVVIISKAGFFQRSCRKDCANSLLSFFKQIKHRVNKTHTETTKTNWIITTTYNKVARIITRQLCSIKQITSSKIFTEGLGRSRLLTETESTALFRRQTSDTTNIRARTCVVSQNYSSRLATAVTERGTGAITDGQTEQ